MNTEATPAANATSPLVGSQEEQQITQLDLLDQSDQRVAALLASQPTFDTVLGHYLIAQIRLRFTEEDFPGLHQRVLDPDALYINTFSVGADGTRKQMASQTFMAAMKQGLITDTAATYSSGAVVLSDHPEAIEEADSLLGCPASAEILRTLATALYIAEPGSNRALHEQLTGDYRQWRTCRWGEALDNPQGLTAEAFLTHEFQWQYQYALQLYKTDRPPQSQLTSTERTQQQRDDNLLDDLAAHPSREARNRLGTSPVAQAHAVRLMAGDGKVRKWPAAMVLKLPGQTRLFLYSREGGFQRFSSPEVLKEEVQLHHAGTAWTIQGIDDEPLEQVFEQAARDLFDQQYATLVNVLHEASRATLTIESLAKKLEDASSMPMAGVEGLVAAHNRDVLESMRPAFYKTATRARQKQYRALEKKIVAAQRVLSELTRDIPTLNQFARQQAREYLHKSYPGLDPDPDQMVIRFDVPEVKWHHWMTVIDRAIFGDQSHAMSLTELVINNLPAWKAEASKDIVVLMPTKLRDSKGDELVNPANGYHIVLGPDYIETLVKTCDVDKNYRALLHKTLQDDTPTSRAIASATQALTLLTLKLKSLEAALKDNGEVFRAQVCTEVNGITLTEKQVPRWLETVLLSPEPASRLQVNGRDVQVCRLFLGNSFMARPPAGYWVPDPASIDGVLVFSDHLQGGQTVGTVGVYFPDSPDGNDICEFADLKTGVRELLNSEEWQGYFTQRIATANKSEIKHLLGLTGSGALVSCLPLRGHFIRELAQAGVRFQIRHADHRARSNAEVELRTRLNLVLTAAEVLPTVSTLGAVGLRAARGTLITFNTLRATGLLPQDKGVFALVYRATEGGRKVLATAPRAMATARVPKRPFFNAPQRQPEGRLGYELGGKRPAASPLTPQPGPSRPRLETPTPNVPVVQTTAGRISDAIRRPGNWNTPIMDLVPSLMTELADWPRHRALLILDEISAGQGWSVRYSPGRHQVTHPTVRHPERTVSDVVLRRIESNHYQMWRNRRWEDVPADGNCFFNALAGALAGRGHSGHSGQNLRARVADHIDQHPQVADYVVSRRTPVQQALFDVAYPLEGILGNHAFAVLTRIVNGQSYESQLASAMANNPELIDDWPDSARQLITLRAENNGVLPVDLLSRIEEHLAVLGLFRPAIRYLNNIANWPNDRQNRQLLWTTRTGEAHLPAELLQIIAAYLPFRNPVQGLFQRDRDIRAFLNHTLLPGPQLSQGLDRLLQRFARRYIWPSNEVMYILLEYGLTVQELTDHYRAIGFDDAGNRLEPDPAEIDRFLDDYLAFFERNPERNNRDDLFVDREALLSNWRAYDEGQRSVASLRVALGRFADLSARADIVLRSDVFSFHLGWSVGLEELAYLIRDPRLSNARLRIISDYLETRAGEMQEHEIVDTEWMRPFDDHNLRNIVERALNRRRHPGDRAFADTLLEFVAYMSEQTLNDSFAMSYVTAAFTPASGRLSNSRVALLLDIPDLFTTLSRHPRTVAQPLWGLLISPEYSDETMRLALGTSTADALRDLRHFSMRLKIASWVPEVD
ncbi:hypothetical protein [Pseudomonas gingeri]|uniref:OTU domain-containing protein n=1 Tax=Pseudomonas gingeri TaxID=117681 RepID=A0A7Y7WSD9_9PSED|nr:hypothetical protein [Pseudomonas gingeri]NWB86395.1 hypothetical protein [Pseudomonas gingeri]